MITWISRLMIFVFSFYLFAPQLAQAQQATPSRADLYRQVATQAQNQEQETPLDKTSFRAAQTHEELEELYATVMLDLALKYEEEDISYSDLKKVVQDMHETTAEYLRMDTLLSNFDPNVPPPHVASTTAYNPPGRASMQRQMDLLAQQTRPQNAFLEWLSYGEATLEDLIEVIDPIDGDITPYGLQGSNVDEYNSLLLTTYAAEYVFYVLSQYTNPEDAKTLKHILPRLQARAFHRLRGAARGDVLARGTLRVMLWQAHLAYKTAGMQDPISENTYEQFASSFQNESRTMKQEHNRLAERIEEFVDGLNYMFASGNDVGGGMLDRVLEVQFAVNYAFLREKVSDLYGLVDAIEDKPGTLGPTPMQNRHSDMLGTLFGTLVEQLENTSVKPAVFAEAVTFLVDMSGPNHGTDTRVLAIGAAGRLNDSEAEAVKAYARARTKERGETEVPFSVQQQLGPAPTYNGPTVQGAQEWQEYQRRQQEAWPTQLLTSLPISLSQREKLVKHAVDIYAPLNGSVTAQLGIVRWIEKQFDYAHAAYNLNSEQMRVLADDLARIINTLLPVSAPQTLWNEVEGHYFPGNSILLQRGPKTPTLSATTHAPSSQKRLAQRAPVFFRDSNGQAVPVYSENILNPLKVEAEYQEAGVNLIVDTILWMFIFKAIKLAFQALKTVVQFSPAAFRAGFKVGVSTRRAAWTRTMMSAREAAGIGPEVKNLSLAQRWQVLKEFRFRDALNFRQAWSKAAKRFGGKIRQGWAYRQSAEEMLAERGITEVTTRTEQVRPSAAPSTTPSAGPAPIGEPPTALPSPANAGPTTTATSGWLDMPVSRRGFGYITGPTAQAGATPFWKRMWQSLIGDVPEPTKFTFVSQRPAAIALNSEVGMETTTQLVKQPVTFLEFDASTFGTQTSHLVHAFGGNFPSLASPITLANINSPLSKARLLYILQSEGMNVSLLSAEEQLGALLTQMTNSGLQTDKYPFPGSRSFDYYAFDGTQWRAVTPREFEQFSTALNQQAASLGSTMPNYYQTLGISPEATWDEIHQAYKNLAAQYHESKWLNAPRWQQLLAEQRLSTVNEAYTALDKLVQGKTVTVGGQTVASRAAYDELLGKTMMDLTKPVAAEGLPFTLKVDPTTGCPLAVSPHQTITELGLPEGGAFNPIQDAQAFGVNASNVGGDLAPQLVEHLRYTGQADAFLSAPVRLANNPVINDFWSMFKTFGITFPILDRWAYSAQSRMRAEGTQQASQELMDSYGDVFAPNPEDPPTAPTQPTYPDVMADLNAHYTTESEISAGASFLWLADGLRTLFGTFRTTAAEREQVEYAANKIKFSRALEQIPLNRDLRADLTYADQMRQMYEQGATENPAHADEYRAIAQLLEDYRQQLEGIQQIQNAKRRQREFNDARNNIQTALQEAETSLNRTLLAEGVADNLQFLANEEQKVVGKPTALTSVQQATFVNLLNDTRTQLQDAAKMDDINAAMLAYQQAMNAWTNGINQLNAQMEKDAAPQAWDQRSDDTIQRFLEEDWQQTISIYEGVFPSRFAPYGQEAVNACNALWQASKQELRNILNSRTLTVREKEARYQQRASQLYNEMSTLLNGYEIESRRDLEETLPDVSPQGN